MSDTTTCPYCAEQILAAAKKCKHCGEFLDVARPPNPDGATEHHAEFRCGTCGETRNTAGGLESHRQQAHGSPVKTPRRGGMRPWVIVLVLVAVLVVVAPAITIVMITFLGNSSETAAPANDDVAPQPSDTEPPPPLPSTPDLQPWLDSSGDALDTNAAALVAFEAMIRSGSANGVTGEAALVQIGIECANVERATNGLAAVPDAPDEAINRMLGVQVQIQRDFIRACSALLASYPDDSGSGRIAELMLSAQANQRDALNWSINSYLSLTGEDVCSSVDRYAFCEDARTPF